MRHAEPALGDGPLTWLDRSGSLLAFERQGADGSIVRCALNLGEASIALPAAWGTQVLAASGDTVAELHAEQQAHHVLGGETAIWLR